MILQRDIYILWNNFSIVGWKDINANIIENDFLLYKPSKLFDVKNRNVVITGSSGLLGSQYANTLSEAGANVILVDLESKKNKTLEKSLVKKYRTNARSYTSDISNLQEVKKLAKNVLKDF